MTPQAPGVSIDPALRATALVDVPEIDARISFAEFSRTARPGDVLEHLAGRETHKGDRVVITAISSRRLTTRPADDPADGDRESRMPVQVSASFVSDGDLVCFKHSGFAIQGGYNLLRWIRQPLSSTGVSDGVEASSDFRPQPSRTS